MRIRTARSRSSISATAQAGATLAQLPQHSLSLWNRYEFTPRRASALGVIHRGDMFTSTDNTVTLPGLTRVDAAVFYNALADGSARRSTSRTCSTRDYYAYANSNNNITPGSPRALRLSLTTRF